MDTANTKREGRLETNGRCLPSVLERNTVRSWMLQRYINVLPFSGVFKCCQEFSDFVSYIIGLRGWLFALLMRKNTQPPGASFVY